MDNFSPAFRFALSFVVSVEGGYSNRPKNEDPGGATMRGITAGTFRSYVEDHPEDSDMPATVRELTRDQAARIYHVMFWSECSCDAMPPAVALVVFNAAVQSGPDDASCWLQGVLQVRQDGIIGPKTLRALRGVRDTEDLVCRYLQEQLFYEMTLQNWKHNDRGWTRRLFRVAMNAERIEKQLVTAEDVRNGLPAFTESQSWDK